MAKFLSMLVFVFTLVSFMSHTIFSQEYDYPVDAGDIPPIPDYIEPPSGSKQDYKYYTDKEFAFLESCLKKVDDSDCASEISTDMDDGTTIPLTIKCCRELLKIGRDCHLVVANFTSVPMYGYTTSNAVAKSKYTWKDCVRRIESYIAAPQQSQDFDQYLPEIPENVNTPPTPDSEIHDPYDPLSEADSPSFEYTPPPDYKYYSDKEFAFLEGCLKKVDDSDCVSEISKDMEDATTIPLTIECCRELLKIGRDCHLVVANFTSMPIYGYSSASNAVAKSKYTWKDCVRRIKSYIGAPISLE